MTNETRVRLIRWLGWVVLGVGALSLASGVLISQGRFDSWFLSLVSVIKASPVAPHWLPELHRLAPTIFGLGLILVAVGILVFPMTSQVVSTEPDAAEGARGLGLHRWDAFALGLFAAFAVVLTIGRLQGNVPYTDLGGDAANVAAFSAARAHPEMFVGDELLGNLQNIRYYLSATLPMLELLKRATGDYGLAFTALLPFHVIIELSGFYFLARYLMNSRLWGFLFASISAMPLPLNLGEYWGLSLIPLPRATFQALLPFVLLAALAWRDRPARWPWVMLMAGGLTYTHLVSGPTWALALWMGFWLFLPTTWSWRRKLAIMFLLGLTYLLAISPFALTYLQSHASAKAGDYGHIMSILKEMYPSKILDTPAAILEFVWILAKLALLPLAAFLGLLLWLIRFPLPKVARLIGMWYLGILTSAGLIPWIEHAIEQAYRLTPIQIDLVRGVRYLVPFLLLLIIWPLSLIYARLRRAQNARAGYRVLAAGLITIGVWAFLYPPFPVELGQGFACLLRGQLVCAPSETIGQTLDAVDRLTPTGARFLATALPMQLRYRSLRPVLYNRRDGDILGMANHVDLLTWEGRDLSMQGIAAKSDPKIRLEMLVDLGRQLGADYLLIDFPTEPISLADLHAQAVYVNPPYSLIRLP
jgi:hypothetical protein